VWSSCVESFGRRCDDYLDTNFQMNHFSATYPTTPARKSCWNSRTETAKFKPTRHRHRLITAPEVVEYKSSLYNWVRACLRLGKTRAVLSNAGCYGATITAGRAVLMERPMQRRDLPTLTQSIGALVILLTTVYVLLSPRFDVTTRQWAQTTIAGMLAYWCGRKSR